MLKTMILSILTLSLANAQDTKTYIDLGTMAMNYTDNGTLTDLKPVGVKWTVGYVIKDFDKFSLGVETSFATGAKSSKKSTITTTNGVVLTNSETTLEELFNANIKTIVPLKENFNANIYVGATRAKLLSIADGYASKNKYDNSISYGAGVEYWFPKNISIYGDYMQYFDNVNAIEIGIGFRF